MKSRRDEALLRDYVDRRSQDAFGELVRRYGTLVYGACLRELKRSDLPAQRFTAEYYLKEGSTLQVNLAEGGSKIVNYSLAKGTLLQQINAAAVRR